MRDRYGSWAVVTGASDGIGRAFAQALAAQGLDLVLVARRGPELEQLGAVLTRDHRVRCRVLALDLAQRDACDTLIDATRDLDVGLLVAAAGFGTSGALVDARAADEAQMIDVNCRAAMLLARAYAQRFVRQGRGGIVLLSSLLAFQGVARAANYAATKAYLQTLAEGMRAELAPRGVDVIACAPGPVRSGFSARADMKMGAALTPDVVAQRTLAALGHRGTVRPGWLSWMLEAPLAPLPRALRTRILGRVMAGMTAHQRAAAASPARAP